MLGCRLVSLLACNIISVFFSIHIQCLLLLQLIVPHEAPFVGCFHCSQTKIELQWHHQVATINSIGMLALFAIV